MTQRQAALTSVGEYLQRREGYEKQQQLEWARCRWMAWGIFSPFVGKNKPRTPAQWVKFPWERNQPTPMIEITESDIMTLNDIFNDFAQRKNKHSS
jgi:hypothetical protein